MKCGGLEEIQVYASIAMKTSLKMKINGFYQMMMMSMEHIATPASNAQIITATAIPASWMMMMMKIFFGIAVIAKGTTVLSVWRLKIVGFVRMGFASIVTNYLNVISAMAKYAPDVLRINMTAQIVANFTVSIVFNPMNNEGMNEGWKDFAIGAINFAVAIVEEKIRKGYSSVKAASKIFGWQNIAQERKKEP